MNLRSQPHSERESGALEWGYLDVDEVVAFISIYTYFSSLTLPQTREGKQHFLSK